MFTLIRRLMYLMHLTFDDKARREIIFLSHQLLHLHITSSRYVRLKDERKPNKIGFLVAKATFLDSSKSYKPHEVVEKHFPYGCKGYGLGNP